MSEKSIDDTLKSEETVSLEEEYRLVGGPKPEYWAEIYDEAVNGPREDHTKPVLRPTTKLDSYKSCAKKITNIGKGFVIDVIRYVGL